MTYRTYLLCLLLGFGVVTPILTSSCASPNTRVATVATLKAVGHTAEAAVSLSATLYADGKITEKQAWDVMNAYNVRFQPAFRVAVSVAKYDTQAVAPAELFNLANELAALVASYQK